MRFFKAFMSAGTVKRFSPHLLSRYICAATLISCVLNVRLKLAHAAPLEQCSEQEGIWFVPAEGLERIAINHPGVACAFRHKSQGFPSFNIVTTPRFEPSARRSQRAWEAEILESYHKIGLVDATIETPGVAAIPDYSGPSAVLRYANRGIPMSAIVAEVEADDRAYTLTALDRSDNFAHSRGALEALMRSVQLRGLNASHATEGRRPAVIATIVALLLFALITVGYRQRAKR